MAYLPNDIKDYYESTHVHYKKWWKLDQHLALHYGVWTPEVKSFAESIKNTNQIMLDAAQLEANHEVLDAGCGVGGAAFFIHQSTGAKVTGISLSPTQINMANELAQKHKLESKLNFQLRDYLKSEFPKESFDLVWACESICHAKDKKEFFLEVHRILKPGGKLVLVDYFKTKDDQKDPNQWIKKWLDTWAIARIISLRLFKTELESTGFTQVRSTNYTQEIYKSSRFMYLASLAGALPTKLYKLYNPKASKFSQSHYKGGIYQFRALKDQLWEYHLVVAHKADKS